MKKILIAYHSGSGSTETVARALKDRLESAHQVDLARIGPKAEGFNLSDYDAGVLGFPTYHAEPPKSMKEFVDSLSYFDTPLPLFLFTTYGLYTGNCVRMVKQAVEAKNACVFGYEHIRGPGSDGALMFPPWITFMFHYEKSARQRLDDAASRITVALTQGATSCKAPRYKWYVPANDLMNVWGRRKYDSYKSAIRSNSEMCSGCGLCEKDCIRGCWTLVGDKASVNLDNCEFCLRCIHRCPEKAIYFHGSQIKKPHLNKAYYNKLKNEELSHI